MSRSSVLLLAALAACASSRHPRTSPLVGRPVAIAAPDLAGQLVSVVADGARVRVVEFWASWCEPCRDQFPALDRLFAAHRERGLAVYAVSFDEDRAQIEEFLDETPVGFRILWDKGGESLSGPLAIDRLPTVLVLDREGVVRHAHLGGGPRHAEDLEREVRALLGE